MDTPSSLLNPAKSSLAIPSMLDPRILRIPISLERRSAVNMANPNKPRQEMMMAMPAKYLESDATTFSDS